MKVVPMAAGLGLVLLLSQCTSEADVVGTYGPLATASGYAETLVMLPDHRYTYQWRSRAGTFRNAGPWRLETRQGYTYVVLDNWRLARPGCGSQSERGSVAEAELDGDVLFLIKDLPDCAYRKQAR